MYEIEAIPMTGESDSYNPASVDNVRWIVKIDNICTLVCDSYEQAVNYVRGKSTRFILNDYRLGRKP